MHMSDGYQRGTLLLAHGLVREMEKPRDVNGSESLLRSGQKGSTLRASISDWVLPREPFEARCQG